jgi:hypothetical protein
MGEMTKKDFDNFVAWTNSVILATGMMIFSVIVFMDERGAARCDRARRSATHFG